MRKGKPDGSYMVLLSVALFSAIAGAAVNRLLSSHPDVSGWIGRADYWFERYQTLLAGLAAVLVAIVSVQRLSRQIAVQRAQAIADRKFALRHENDALLAVERFCKMPSIDSDKFDEMSLGYPRYILDQHRQHLPFMIARLLELLGRDGTHIEKYPFASDEQQHHMGSLEKLKDDFRENTDTLGLLAVGARSNLNQFFVLSESAEREGAQ